MALQVNASATALASHHVVRGDAFLTAPGCGHDLRFMLKSRGSIKELHAGGVVREETFHPRRTTNPTVPASPVDGALHAGNTSLHKVRSKEHIGTAQTVLSNILMARTGAAAAHGADGACETNAPSIVGDAPLKRQPSATPAITKNASAGRCYASTPVDVSACSASSMPGGVPVGASCCEVDAAPPPATSSSPVSWDALPQDIIVHIALALPAEASQVRAAHGRCCHSGIDPCHAHETHGGARVGGDWTRQNDRAAAHRTPHMAAVHGGGGAHMAGRRSAGTCVSSPACPLRGHVLHECTSILLRQAVGSALAATLVHMCLSACPSCPRTLFATPARPWPWPL